MNCSSDLGIQIESGQSELQGCVVNNVRCRESTTDDWMCVRAMSRAVRVYAANNSTNRRVR